MSGAVSDTSRILRLKSGHVANHSVPITGHLDFFPPDIIGRTRRNGAKKGVEIVLDGLDETINTDIACDAATGKPRRVR